MPGPADDNVVVHVNVERGGDIDDRLRRSKKQLGTSIGDCKQRSFVLHHGHSREFPFLIMHAHERKSASAQTAYIPQQLSVVREVPATEVASITRSPHQRVKEASVG